MLGFQKVLGRTPTLTMMLYWMQLRIPESLTITYIRHINVLHLAYITVNEFDIQELWGHLNFSNCKL